MARQSRELGFDPSTPFAEETPDLGQPSSFQGLFGDPTPVSQTVGHQPLHVGDPLCHDSFVEGFSTTAGPGWAAPTSTFENNPFTINHDASEPWLRAPTSSARDVSCYEPGAVDSTDPKEPTQPAKRSPNPTRGGERRVKKKTSSGHQHSSRPNDIHRDLRCPYSGCEYDRPFSTNGTLRRHINTQHQNPWAFKCLEPTCDRLFKRKDNRDDHLRREHLKEWLHIQSHGS